MDYYTHKIKKGKIIYASRYEDVCEGVVIASLFLTSALDGGEWSALRPCQFTPWKGVQVQETWFVPEPV
jgi:hypothetical protein